MRRLVVWTLLLAACSSRPEPAGLTIGEGSISAAAIVAMGNAAATAWPSDPILIRSAVIRGDSLHIEAEHGGGCGRHGYALIVGPAWMESFPVQIGARLAHDANGTRVGRCCSRGWRSASCRCATPTAVPTVRPRQRWSSPCSLSASRSRTGSDGRQPVPRGS